LWCGGHPDHFSPVVWWWSLEVEHGTWKFDARKSQKFIFSLGFESDKNGQSKRAGYL
jgi:hypothetical protein